VFVPIKLFQRSLMFVGNAGSYPSEAPFGCFTLGLAPILICRLVKLVGDEHFNLLRSFVNFRQKKFYKPLVTLQAKATLG